MGEIGNCHPIKTDTIPSDQINGHRLYVTTKEKHWLELKNMGFDEWGAWKFKEQESCLAYPDLAEIKQMLNTR